MERAAAVEKLLWLPRKPEAVVRANVTATQWGGVHVGGLEKKTEE